MPKKPTLLTKLGKLILYRNTTRCPLFWQVFRQCRQQGRTKANTLRFFYEDYKRRKADLASKKKERHENRRGAFPMNQPLNPNRYVEN